jgi:hypothetical protein
VVPRLPHGTVGNADDFGQLGSARDAVGFKYRDQLCCRCSFGFPCDVNRICLAIVALIWHIFLRWLGILSAGALPGRIPPIFFYGLSSNGSGLLMHLKTGMDGWGLLGS